MYRATHYIKALKGMLTYSQYSVDLPRLSKWQYSM